MHTILRIKWGFNRRRHLRIKNETFELRCFCKVLIYQFRKVCRLFITKWQQGFLKILVIEHRWKLTMISYNDRLSTKAQRHEKFWRCCFTCLIHDNCIKSYCKQIVYSLFKILEIVSSWCFYIIQSCRFNQAWNLRRTRSVIHQELYFLNILENLVSYIAIENTIVFFSKTTATCRTTCAANYICILEEFICKVLSCLIWWHRKFNNPIFQYITISIIISMWTISNSVHPILYNIIIYTVRYEFFLFCIIFIFTKHRLIFVAYILIDLAQPFHDSFNRISLAFLLKLRRLTKSQRFDQGQIPSHVWICIFSIHQFFEGIVNSKVSLGC